MNSSALLARITPRLPESRKGFSTQGYVTCPAIQAGSSSSENGRKTGQGAPPARIKVRMSSLSRAASAAFGALHGHPRAALARAGSTVALYATDMLQARALC